MRLSQLEIECIKVLWQKQSASVAEVKSGVSRPLAYTTVMTVLDRMREKGVVIRQKQGRAYVYSPALDRKAARLQAVRRLLENLFDQDPQELVRFVLEHSDSHQPGDRRARPRKAASYPSPPARSEMDDSLL
jgi:predicted transcriptional regulator